MRLRNEFLSHKHATEAFIIPTDKANFSGLVRGNKAFGDVIDLLKSDITEDEIVRAMLAKYDAPEEVIRHDVRKGLDALRSAGALSE
ncbi:MAG: PqqD family protein [Synergistaceae bacterium]|nr:PqqD family protein [Synergistaceae bacterium]